MTATILLPPFLVRKTHDRHVPYGGVLPEHVLDLRGGDVLSAADDGVVGPTLNEEVSVSVEASDVMSGKPAIVVKHGPDAAVFT